MHNVIKSRTQKRDFQIPICIHLHGGKITQKNLSKVNNDKMNTENCKNICPLLLPQHTRQIKVME
jgi:hypothetical protein